MKTAISIPDPLFERADVLARQFHISRSELYARAVERFVEDYDQADTRATSDEVSSLDLEPPDTLVTAFSD